MGARLKKILQVLHLTKQKNGQEFLEKIIPPKPAGFKKLPDECDAIFGKTRTVPFDFEAAKEEKPLRRTILSSTTDFELISEGDKDKTVVAKTVIPRRYAASYRNLFSRAFFNLPMDAQDRVSNFLTSICKENFIIPHKSSIDNSEYIFDLLFYEAKMMEKSGFTLDRIKKDLYAALSDRHAARGYPELEIMVNCITEALSERYIKVVESDFNKSDMKYLLRSLDPRIYFDIYVRASENNENATQVISKEDGDILLSGRILDEPEGGAKPMQLEIKKEKSGRTYNAKVGFEINKMHIGVTDVFYPFRIVEQAEAIDAQIRAKIKYNEEQGIPNPPGIVRFKSRAYFVERVFRVYPLWKKGYKPSRCLFFIDPEFSKDKHPTKIPYCLSFTPSIKPESDAVDVRVSLFAKPNFLFMKHKVIWSALVTLAGQETIKFIGNMEHSEVLNPFSAIKEETIKGGISELQMAVCLVNGHLFIADFGKNNLRPSKNAIYAGKYSV